MNDITSKLSRLKNNLESAAFLVSKEGGAKEACSKIALALVILSELNAAYLNSQVSSSSVGSDSKEINKVTRRLNLWAKRQNHINSKILNAYLELERSGVSVITIKSIKAKLSDDCSFENNFIQMRIIADKNRGKVFEKNGDRISLWPSVVTAVREYEKKIFGR